MIVVHTQRFELSIAFIPFVFLVRKVFIIFQVICDNVISISAVIILRNIAIGIVLETFLKQFPIFILNFGTNQTSYSVVTFLHSLNKKLK